MLNRVFSFFEIKLQQGPTEIIVEFKPFVKKVVKLEPEVSIRIKPSQSSSLLFQEPSPTTHAR